MARKPETVFRTSVHKHLSPKIYRMPNANTYVGGVPDTYYEGIKGHLWVEYKFVPKVPRILKLSTQYLSDLQRAWLNRAYGNGQRVAVIVGFPTGGCIFEDKLWDLDWDNDEISNSIKQRKLLAEFITEKVGAFSAT